jgi:RecB family exonuclease
MSIDLLDRETLSERQGGVWSYISPSRLALWARCPLAFRFRYVDGIKTPTSPSMFLGQRVHAGLELFYRHRQLGISLPAEAVTKRVDSSHEASVAEAKVEFNNAEEEENLRRQVGDLLRAYIAQVPTDEARPLAVETAMEVPLTDPATKQDLGVPLVGIVDLVLNADDGPTIIDFKTAARGGELLEIAHEIQLTAYSLAYRAATGRHEGSLQIRRLVKTKVPKIETHCFPARSDAHFRRLFSLVRAYLDDLDADRFVFRPGWTCSSCEFCKPHCRRWNG